ncbi:acetyl-CoA carboxylase biotin carboxyl carrier protein [Elusimicrobiota bacterium]
MPVIKRNTVKTNAKTCSRGKMLKHDLLEYVDELYAGMVEGNVYCAQIEISSGESLKIERVGNVGSNGSRGKHQEDGKEFDSNEKIFAPLSGVFYRCPSPSSPPFVEDGGAIRQGRVICLVEAMKVMNEIKSPKTCVISQILAQNGKHVKKGDPLFVIK